MVLMALIYILMAGEGKYCGGRAFQRFCSLQMAQHFLPKCDRIGQQYQWAWLQEKPIWALLGGLEGKGGKRRKKSEPVKDKDHK